MATTIEVNKQSVKQLLEEGKEHPFVIPEYQRPYAWSYDEIETLFNDIWEFTETKGGASRNATYFLGSIVSYLNKSGEQEIIDGQQRITSLFLLLRAIYTKLNALPAKTKEAQNFLNQIAPALWRTNKLTGEVNYSDILLTSKVINNDGNEILQEILSTGKAKEKAKDNYSKNYAKFLAMYEQASKDNPLMIYDFIYALLNQAILLPISADNQDTALTIFSTLNNRGMPLSDADIFKANIYNKKSLDEKKAFIRQWQELDEKATYADESIQQLFYYYMFYLRAEEKNNDNTIPGVRKYYEENKFARLFDPFLLDRLEVILNIWLVVTKHEKIEGESWSENKDILKVLDTLNSYPNEFWKYPVIIYYLCHRDEEQFEEHFLLFLRKLLAELLTRYLMMPAINAVKSDIIKLNIEIIGSSLPTFSFREMDTSLLAEKIKSPHRNAVRMLLKILAYDEQSDLLPEKWEIEHIFPQKWQTNFFPDMNDDIIQEKIEHLGNKLPFEKKLNIVAGNGYFAKKKAAYADSKIAATFALSNIPENEWTLDSITERDVRVSDKIIEIISEWKAAYANCLSPAPAPAQPTAEELALIEKFKANHWV